MRTSVLARVELAGLAAEVVRPAADVAAAAKSVWAVGQVATDSAEAPEASVEENVGEVPGKIDPEASLASVDEAALVFEEKGVARV